MEQSQLVQRAVQRLRDGIARRETTLDLEAIKAVLVEMATQKERADTFERRVVKAELESEELARRIGDQSARLATVAIERDGYSKVINELTKQIQERDARLAKAHTWEPDGGVLRFESHPGCEDPHVHTTCAKCGARAWFPEHQWELLAKGCKGEG